MPSFAASRLPTMILKKSWASIAACSILGQPVILTLAEILADDSLGLEVECVVLLESLGQILNIRPALPSLWKTANKCPKDRAKFVAASLIWSMDNRRAAKLFTIMDALRSSPDDVEAGRRETSGRWRRGDNSEAKAAYPFRLCRITCSRMMFAACFKSLWPTASNCPVAPEVRTVSEPKIRPSPSDSSTFVTSL